MAPKQLGNGDLSLFIFGQVIETRWLNEPFIGKIGSSLVMVRSRELYRIGGLPLFQNRTYANREEARGCPRGDMRLVEDLETGLIYNADFDPNGMVYDESYQNEQAMSPMFAGHLEQMAQMTGELLGREALLEIGCGKGHFLDMLVERGMDVSGVDPTFEGDHPRVIKEYFSSDLGMRGKGLILRHVLEHIQDPFAFLDMVRKANGNSGRIYIEVPCFDWICAQRNWFDVFYEHVNYFRLSDFQRMFGVVHVKKHVFGDQYLCVVAELSSLRKPEYDDADRARFPGDFTSNMPQASSGMAGGIVWGGASKGVLFALLSERAGRPIEAVIDINPAKQGRFLPVTGVKVGDPKDVLPNLVDGTTIYVMNPNYLSEIRQMSGHRFSYVGVSGSSRL